MFKVLNGNPDSTEKRGLKAPLLSHHGPMIILRFSKYMWSGVSHTWCSAYRFSGNHIGHEMGGSIILNFILPASYHLTGWGFPGPFVLSCSLRCFQYLIAWCPSIVPITGSVWSLIKFYVILYSDIFYHNITCMLEFGQISRDRHY